MRNAQEPFATVESDSRDKEAFILECGGQIHRRLLIAYDKGKIALPEFSLGETLRCER